MYSRRSKKNLDFDFFAGMAKYYQKPRWQTKMSGSKSGRRKTLQ